MVRQERTFSIVCDNCDREIPKDDYVHYCDSCGVEICDDCICEGTLCPDCYETVYGEED